MLAANCQHINWGDCAGTFWEAIWNHLISNTWSRHTPLECCLYWCMNLCPSHHYFTTRHHYYCWLQHSPLSCQICHCVRLRLPNTNWQNERNINSAGTAKTEAQHVLCESIYKEWEFHNQFWNDANHCEQSWVCVWTNIILTCMAGCKMDDLHDVLSVCVV